MVYSYWDGSGHRKSIKVKKGASVGKFLEQVKQQIVSEFSEIRSISSEDLLYVKEDLIIPHVRMVTIVYACRYTVSMQYIHFLSAHILLRFDRHESEGQVRTPLPL